MASRLPEELWLEVSGRLPRETTLELYQADRRFRRILRARIFSQFTFHYASKRDYSMLHLSAERVAKGLERLAFRSSIDIAPMVRRIDVRLYPPTHPSASDSVHSSVSAEPHKLLSAFFECLGRFTRLHNLSCTEIQSFSQGFINNLCGLPELTTLSIAGSVGLNVGSSSLKFQKLRLLDLSGWHTLDRVDHSGWIPLLRPELLTELQLQIHPQRIREIAPSFPHVTKLRLTLVASEHAVDIRPILPKFAALRILAILDNADQREEPNDRGVVPSFLPPLQEFTGPVWALKTFLYIPTLAHLTIGYCSVPQVLLTELQSIGAQLTVTSLRLSMFSFTQTFFMAFFELFPALTALRIDSAKTDGQADIFLETFAESIPLPPHLAQLALAWNNTIVDVDAPTYSTFRQNLTAQYPAVDAVLLCFFNTMRLWRRTADGDKEVNETAFMQGDGLGYHNILSKVEIMRDTFNSTWGEVSRAR
ncbi:hypothetical protein C8R46DRAFT_1129764 [Mycena filopes]|nr:hypothetical protein C8R46DRAFT_1129764 [Mycena filopes]